MMKTFQTTEYRKQNSSEEEKKEKRQKREGRNCEVLRIPEPDHPNFGVEKEGFSFVGENAKFHKNREENENTQGGRMWS